MTKTAAQPLAVVPLERIERAILLIRGHKVMLDSDLAGLYGVTVKRLNEQVKRNRDRFPEDFMFQLTQEEALEALALRSQDATLKKGRGRHRKYLPHVFTEHGALMAANVLNSKRATEVSVFVIRTFVRLRHVLASHKELAVKFAELEHKVGKHDEAIRSIVAAIRDLMAEPDDPPKERLGFKPSKARAKG
ncbi:MAG: ORF6N domain-containing protein [Planctomycetes bacterium]|nr:ORF6N domain-containing protein [Planctomycetota bacterium]